MPFFFFVSGCLFRKRDAKNYYYSKIKGLFLPFSFFLLFNILISLFLSYTELSDYEEILLFGGGWFLEALFYIVVFFFLFCSKLERYMKHVDVGLCAIALLDLAVGICYSELIKGTENPIAAAMIGYFFYSCGYFFKNYADTLFQSTWANGVIAGILLIGTFWSARRNTRILMFLSEYGNYGKFIMNALMGCIGLLLLSKVIQSNRVLEFYGKNSLIVLLTHFQLVRWLPGIVHTHIGSITIAIVISFAIMLAVEYLIIRFAKLSDLQIYLFHFCLEKSSFPNMCSNNFFHG